MIAAREKRSIAEDIMEGTTMNTNVLGVFQEDCPVSLGVEVDVEIKVEISKAWPVDAHEEKTSFISNLNHPICCDIRARRRGGFFED